MKLLIFSDSHGNTSYMERAALENSDCDALLFLGDGCREFYAACDIISKPGYAVRGNNDLGTQEPEVRTVEFDGVKILMCHGHTLSVYAGVSRIASAARGAGAQVAFFGHTHRPYYEVKNGVRVINPGSIGQPRGCGRTYGVMNIKDGEIDYISRSV